MWGSNWFLSHPRDMTCLTRDQTDSVKSPNLDVQIVQQYHCVSTRHENISITVRIQLYCT